MTGAAPTVAAAPARRRPGAGSVIARVLSSMLLLGATMALVAVAAAAAVGVRVRVEQTGSMAPALKPGDLVLMRSTPLEQIRIGDIIGVRQESGRVIVHRVERLAGAGAFVRVHTKGDANPTGEDWTIARADQVALVKGRVPALGNVVDAAKGPGIAIAVIVAALLLAGSALRAVWTRT
ncbi:MAG: signal peptidase I [Solirubrobacteraceae bacterium]|nr:signal peptidase I [Solirubrobacteraceae bacterium]